MLSVYYGHPTNSGNRIPGPGSPAQNMDWIGLGLDWNVQLSPCFTTCPRRSTKRKLTDVPRLTDFRYNGLKTPFRNENCQIFYRSSTRYNRNHDVFQFGQICPSSFPAPQPSLQSAYFLRLDASNDVFRRNFMIYPRYLRTRYGVHKLTCVAGYFCCGGALDQSASEH